MQTSSALKGFLSAALGSSPPKPTLHPAFLECWKTSPLLRRFGTNSSLIFLAEIQNVCTSHRSVRGGKVRARNKKKSHWPHTLSISRHFPHRFPGCNPFSPAPLPPRRLKNQTAATPFGAGGGNSGLVQPPPPQGFRRLWAASHFGGPRGKNELPRRSPSLYTHHQFQLIDLLLHVE